MTGKVQSFIDNLCEDYPKNNHIDSDAYRNENVKRGLRNADGTGVLVGLTRIGSAQGYFVQDGDRIPMDGRLLYRGIDVRDLVAGVIEDGRFGFEEIIYLLLCGLLPGREQLDSFTEVIGELRHLPRGFTEDAIMKNPSPDIMNKVASCILALYSYDNDPDNADLGNLLRQSMELTARVPVIVAHAFAVKRHYYDHESLVLHLPQNGLSIAENFLHSIRPDKQYTPEEAHLLDLCLILHAEHGGGNNSTFACRTLSSSGTDTYSAISAAVGSLKGPLHGGANNQVMEMFGYIKRDVKDWEDDDEISAYLEKLIRKQAGNRSGKIYGMGHAVYTLSDPRAILLKKYARDLAPRHNCLAEFNLLEAVERLTPKVFASVKGDVKTISANVDMYSGLVYQMLGIPAEMYTPIFAVARIAGWCAHRIEETMYGGRIMRPAYRNLLGSNAYTPIEER
ncbi:MAG: citrate/2-methylcitrate synthase [Oscillospiraceae bacterium]|jgi:citrate synthase|nr:citrate/2-methylcitrate synthase [Oscillospiraceae bacterium]